MERDRAFIELKEVLHETFGIDPSKTTPDADIRESLDLDSIDLFDLLAILEKRHSIQLSLHDFRDARTIDDVVTRLCECFQKNVGKVSRA